MLCPNCGKESNNIRVCAFCQTPYPTDRSEQAGTSRSTRATAAIRAQKAAQAGGLREVFALSSPVMRWGAIGLLAAFTVGYYIVGRERVIPVGVAVPNIITRPMSPVEATNFLRDVNGTGQVDVKSGALVVRIATAMFPQQRPGQLALAQQYARADEITQGQKRLISFLDPGGSQFAKADPATGVVLTR